MAAKTFALQFQGLVSVTFSGFDGTTRTIRFANKTGGNKTIEVKKIRPGGMAGAVVMPGLDDRDDMTVTKKFDRATDGANIAWIDDNAGCDISAICQPLDANKVPSGPSFQRTGINAGVTDPEIDADSDDPQTWDVTLGVDSEAA